VKVGLEQLVRAARDARSAVHQLLPEPEADLVAEPRRLLVAVCVLNHMRPAQISANYRLSKAEVVTQLLRLDRLQLIALLPENRVRLKVAREFGWLPDGPIQRFFRERVQTDFLDARFGYAGELLRFQYAMLTPAANLRFQQRLLRLVREFTQFHKDCVAFLPKGPDPAAIALQRERVLTGRSIRSAAEFVQDTKSVLDNTSMRTPALDQCND
jgi:hypothetical protein